METIPNRPILRYHGGKWLLAPWLIENFPPHRVYVEPFGGGGSVLLRKDRSYAEVYNDLDGEIVNLFRVVRDRGDELIPMLELTPFARADFMESYQPSGDPLEQARRTLARSFMGFGSTAASGAKTGFRSNSNRSGTTPARDWRNFPEALRGVVDRLRGVVIEQKDYSELIAQHDGSETLFYADPPYVLDTRAVANRYSKGCYRYEMTDDQHRELAESLRSVRGMVLLSGYACPLYDEELYPDWRRVERPALADGARPRTEILWINPAAASALSAVAPQRELMV